MKGNFKDLAEILNEQGSQISRIGKALMEENYAVIPVSLCNTTMSYNEALSRVNEAEVPVCIVKVMQYIEKGQKFGIVKHALSRLNGKKVRLGKENEHGLIRCADVDRSTNIDYVHKSFIQIL